MSSMSYLSDVYTEHVPKKIISETKQLIRDFLWNGKTWRISQKNLGLDYDDGGIKLADLDNFVECKKLKWIIKIHFSEISNWNAYGKFCLMSQDAKFGVDNFLLQCSNLRGLKIKLPEFYATCISAWINCTSKSKVRSKKDVLNQNICGNKNVTKKQQSIFFPTWTRSKIVKIKDIWDSDLKNWKKGEYIFNKLLIKRNWIAEYSKIKDCIPLSWILMLKDENDLLGQTDVLNYKKKIILSHECITINNINVNYKKVKQRDLYCICLYPLIAPTCITTWSRIFQEALTSKELFVNYKHCIHNRKSLDFHWKTLHRAIYSEERLMLMKKSNGQCKVCNIKKENLCHLLFDCVKIKSIWTNIQLLLNNVTNTNFEITARYVITGYSTDRITNNEHVRNLYNFVIMLTKWFIWKHRNDVKFGTTGVKDSNYIYNCIIKKCKQEISLLESSTKWKKCSPELKAFLQEIKNT